MHEQKIIGLTGGIGSGKSTVARIARVMGLPVFDADDEAKRLYRLFPSLREEVSAEFGSDVFVNGEVQRDLLASRIFASDEGQKTIGRLIRPYLEKQFLLWQQRHSAHRWLIKEAAILVESGTYKACDYVIQVVAPEPVRIERVRKRNGWSTEEIKSRIAAQMNDEERAPYCDFTLVNDNAAAILPQVMSTLNAIMD